MSSVDYFTKLQERVGHSYKGDPKTLATDELVKLGKALSAEWRLVYGGWKATGQMEAVIIKIKVKQDEQSFEQDYKLAQNLVSKCNAVSYGLRENPPSDIKKRLGLRDELWFMQRQVAEIADKHEGELKDLWAEYADWMARDIHYNEGNTDGVNLWLHKLRGEFETRKPGYVAKTIEEQMEEDGSRMTDEEVAAMFAEAADEYDHYEPTEDEMVIEVLEDQVRDLQIQRQMQNVSYDRLERIALGQEEANALQIRALRQEITETQELTILEYQDQLKGLVRETNEKFERNLRLLAEQGDLEGKEIDLYFNGPHPKIGLALRCGDDLRGQPKWRVVIKKKESGNKYLIQQTAPPHKEYEIGLGFDDVDNHFFAFTFFNRKWGRKWMNAELKIVPQANLYKLRAYELIQYHHKINEYFEGKKRAGS